MFNYFKEIITLFAGSLVLITSWAWNDLFVEWVDRQNIFRNKMFGLLVYCIVITFITAIVISLVTKYRLQTNNKFCDRCAKL